MRHRPLRLESFETASQAKQVSELDPIALEEARLAAFEKGYAAGWDDALEAQDKEAARQLSELRQNLQRLSFTYHEARQHILDSLKPLLADMAAKVLPAMARESLPHMVAEQLMPSAESMSAIPITITAHPETLPTIRPFIEADTALPLAFTADPSLGSAEVWLRFADGETRIDLDRVIEMITKAITAYFSINDEEPSDG